MCPNVSFCMWSVSVCQYLSLTLHTFEPRIEEDKELSSNYSTRTYDYGIVAMCLSKEMRSEKSKIVTAPRVPPITIMQPREANLNPRLSSGIQQSR
jgi:hypothetical protein